MAGSGPKFFKTSLAGRRILLGLAALTILLVATMMYFADVIPVTSRESALRANYANKLRTVAQAMLAYQRDFGAIPTIETLAARRELPDTGHVDFGLAHCHAAASQPQRQLLIVQQLPRPAVRKGDPWGGPGEFSQVDRPAVRLVLWSDGTVEELEESIYQRDHAPHLTLTSIP